MYVAILVCGEVPVIVASNIILSRTLSQTIDRTINRKLAWTVASLLFCCTSSSKGPRNSHHDPCRAHLSERSLVVSFCPDMLRFAVNTSGIPRLTKFYTPLHQSSQTLIQKIFSLISIRPAGLCNFLDAPELEAFLGPKDGSDERWRVVYRNYATLYFVFVVDGAESELGILDLIQVNIASIVMPTL